MLRTLAPFALGLLLAVPALDLTLQPDENNLAEGRLEGVWEYDPVVSERLGTSSHREMTLEFRADAAVLQSLPGMWDRQLADWTLFEAGHMTIRSQGVIEAAAPYLLTSLAGNPHIVTFRERDGEPLTDAESFNFLLAPGKESPQDLLMLGGDFDNEPFRAMRRVAETD